MVTQTAGEMEAAVLHENGKEVQLWRILRGQVKLTLPPGKKAQIRIAFPQAPPDKQSTLDFAGAAQALVNRPD